MLETRPRPAEEALNHSGPRFGFTVTKQMGCAVKRNLIKRRLKSIAHAVGLTAGRAQATHDYVVIARAGAAQQPFDELTRDFERALQRIHHSGQHAANKPRDARSRS